MAHKIFSSISMLLAVGIVAAVCSTPALAQTTEPPASGDVQRRCTSLALTSDTPMLPVRLVEPYLQQRADFQASKMALTEEPDSADAIVTLTRSGERDTHIQVSSRITGRQVSALSLWTDYPGMVASDVMEQLKVACPGSVVAPAENSRPVAGCRKPAPELRSVTTLAACSQTSWMDNRDIHKALESRPELKQWAVRVTPACDGDGADAVLEITHNLNWTVEWSWTLRTHGGSAISSGLVIAFDKRGATSKIALAVTREVAAAHGTEVPVSADSSAAESYGNSGHSVPVLLLPTDFSVLDTRASLYIDSERVITRDTNNRVLFSVTREEIRDARRRADWRRSFQLPDPTPLAGRAWQDFTAVFVNMGLDPTVDPNLKNRSWLCRLEGVAWTVLSGSGSVTTNFCPALDVSKAALSTAGLLGYLGAGTVLAQVPTRAEILEIAWERDGVVQTVALQVPLYESKRLLRALLPAGASEQEQACGSATPVVAQPVGTR